MTGKTKKKKVVIIVANNFTGSLNNKQIIKTNNKTNK